MIKKINEPDVEIKELNDVKEKHKYGIFNPPGLYIDNDFICQGKVLNDREILKLINERREII